MGEFGTFCYIYRIWNTVILDLMVWHLICHLQFCSMSFHVSIIAGYFVN